LSPGQRILEIIEYLFELHSDSTLTANGRLRLNLFRVAELRQALELTQDFSEHPEIEALSAVLKQGHTIKPVREPKGLQAKLRPYQKTGVAWLDFLRAHRMGGILADDMGLGKTLQTLALLQREKNGKRLSHPALIVVPTSVLPNWRNELRQFAPNLTFHYHHGADRHDKTKQAETHDLLLTTYALIRRDAEWFQDQTFSWIILDEAQAIKNPRSQTALCLGRMNSTNRLCLTGTPMENHLGELWSLFHFLTPGFLGGHDTFRKHFQRPIESGAPMLQTALKRRIRPFLLRRTKSEVEQDLPDKVEILETLALTERQHNLYEIIRMAMTERIQAEMQAKGFARSKLMILHALLKLRQICCDPRLAKQEEKSVEKDSCKITWLRNRLPGMIEDGRRILLFSQFTSMLALIENLLNSLHIPYVQLTGSTTDRDTPVHQFQNEDVPVFLLSLKAGGTGLNLTAADTVIHYDPWWNPAAERQATDRAHRIGQDKSVFVYKLITSTSIEERILDMQRRKAQLADSMLDAAARDSKLTFSEEDLQYLLAPLSGDE
jgi:SNF2 family DNA or RNA helicase